MVKMYILAGVLSTYATLSKVYKAGVEYTAEQVGNDKDAVDEQGELFFDEFEVEEGEVVSEGSDNAPKKTTRTVLKIGKKAPAPQEPSAPAGNEGAGNEGAGEGAGDKEEKVTV